jgi:hypothetical protein
MIASDHRQQSILPHWRNSVRLVAVVDHPIANAFGADGNSGRILQVHRIVAPQAGAEQSCRLDDPVAEIVPDTPPAFAHDQMRRLSRRSPEAA